MKKAKLFKNGQSQAVRLPKEFRLKGEDVFVNKINDIVILIPTKKPWDTLKRSLEKFSDDFMGERNQPAQQKRKAMLK